MKTEINIIENIAKEFVFNYFKLINTDEKIEWLNKGTIEDVNHFKKYCEINNEFEICSFIKKYVEERLDQTHIKLIEKLNK